VEKLDEEVLYFATINLLGLGEAGSASANFNNMEDDE
jgi:hypothetical protein